IGTTTPGQRLSVAGDVLGNTFIGSNFTATSSTATSTFAGGLTVETSGFVYDFSSNSVGIGTAAPAAKLDVSLSANELVRLGIGTTSPGFLLSISGATGSNTLGNNNSSATILAGDIIGKIATYAGGDQSNIPNREMSSILTIAEGDYVGIDSAPTSLAFLTHG